MKKAKEFSEREKNRKLPVKKNILTRKSGKLSLRECTSRREEEMEIPSSKNVDWYDSDSGDHIYVPVSKLKNIRPLNTQIDPTRNDYLNDEEFTEVINSKRPMSRPNSPKTLISTSVAKRYKIDQNIPIKVQNRFEPLADQKVNNETDDINKENTSQKVIKIPPIYLSADNFQEIIKDLNLITTSEFTTKQCYKKIKILLTSTDDFRNVTKFYDNAQVKYFTFVNPEERPLSVVMRGVPYSISEEEVKDELIKLNYPVIRTTRLLKTTRTIDGQEKIKSPTPLLAIDLVNNDKGKSIFNIDRFCYSVVSVEPRRRSSAIPQCTNCQRFNHTKNFCRLEPRCVKCAGSHNYKDCPSRRVTTPVCVNCGQNHTANYKGCDYYLKLKNKFSGRQRPQNQQQPNSRPNTSSAVPNRTNDASPPISSEHTYASKLRAKPDANTRNRPTENFNLQSTIEKLIVDIIKPLLPKIQTFITQLITNLVTGFNFTP